ncbi:MAG: hypothetical protein OXH59_20735 [Rhodospirillaceae bacterium]|nr:hypothetical protein [Rhodospirillaceae bacterium]
MSLLLDAYIPLWFALPAIHDDPFDRILVAQARYEGLTLLAADKRVACYPGPIELI